MNITFILPVTSQPRYWKRIKSLERLGCNNKVLAFERKYIPINKTNKNYITIGKIEHKKYYKRILPFVRAFATIRNNIKYSDVTYVFGMDMLLFGWVTGLFINKKNKIVYEVGDIRSILIGNNIQSIFLRWLERFLIKRIDLLVVTSKAYITYYYEKIQGLKDIRYILIENKLNAEMGLKKNITNRINKDNIIRIGYFGIIRCKMSWQILKRVACNSKGRIQIYIRGISMGIDNLDKEANETPNINYDGPYLVPDDLSSIYNNVDLVWSCYPYQGKSVGNWCWARTNRFYESCYFKKPMVAQIDTQDGKMVNKLGLGICVDLSDIDGTANRILKITRKELFQWRKNVSELPQNYYLYTDEHKKLLDALNE